MDLYLSGIKYGLALSILVGPIVFALIQTSIERGFRAGTLVGVGIWTSDLLFILAAYFGVSYIADFIASESFVLGLGIVGGLVLMVLGTITLLSKPPSIPLNNKNGADILDEHLPSILDLENDNILRPPSYFSLWLKGFFINTLNPFTIFFWTGITSTVVLQDNLVNKDAFIFYSSILGTLIFTDLLKVGLAKLVRRFLTPKNILWMRRFSGAALFAFGIALIIRVYFL